MKPTVPAVPRLVARAYAGLLRAYPAPFRAEFGDEMALVFSDCCRAAWRSGGHLGVWRLMGRTVVDMLASAPPLWARFYEIGSNQPIFCDRDGVAKHQLSEIGMSPDGWQLLSMALESVAAETVIPHRLVNQHPFPDTNASRQKRFVDRAALPILSVDYDSLNPHDASVRSVAGSMETTPGVSTS